MVVPPLPSRVSRVFGVLVGFAMTATPGLAASVAQARLVHCGSDTCLRISGHRPSAAVAIRIGGEDLAVEGGRNWRVTVPLATARAWAGSAGAALTLTLADAPARAERAETVTLPPGAFGKRVELASLMVRAH